MHRIQLGIFFIKYRTFFRLQNLIDKVSKIIFLIYIPFIICCYSCKIQNVNKNILQVLNRKMQFQDHLSEDV